jgi:hypothetical protein
MVLPNSSSPLPPYARGDATPRVNGWASIATRLLQPTRCIVMHAHPSMSIDAASFALGPEVDAQVCCVDCGLNRFTVLQKV